MKLSILIATMPTRKALFTKLLSTLDAQIPMNGCVEILWDDSMDYNVGTKRNKLLERARGEYIVYVDDDDHVSKSYVSSILKAIQTNPDCVGICGVITTNGRRKKKWYISKNYEKWFERRNVYYRTPNHISPVKRELALKVRFPESSFGEDYDYSMRLREHLHTEVKIPHEIYHYDYRRK